MSPLRSGRLEKRIRLAVPVQISSLRESSAIERTTTENVCSIGIRVLTQWARELDERVMISSPAGDLRTPARVVYCQRLPGGRFGIGFEFQQAPVSWPSSPLTATAD
jgi:hypothetical protein